MMHVKQKMQRDFLVLLKRSILLKEQYMRYVFKNVFVWLFCHAALRFQIMLSFSLAANFHPVERAGAMEETQSPAG